MWYSNRVRDCPVIIVDMFFVMSDRELCGIRMIHPMKVHGKIIR